MVKSKRPERLKARPSHKSARVRANYTLLVPLILFAQSTDLLCSEALGQKRSHSTAFQLLLMKTRHSHDTDARC